MLLEMGIENFILIKKLNLTFKEGLNVFTGETGAGKSMIIGGINIGLGEKVPDHVVGFGAEKAVIQLVFSVENQDVELILEDYGVTLEEGLLIITREIFVSNRTVVRMNGRMVTLSVLKEVSKLLIDVHGQHAHQALLYPKNHMHYLDLMGDDDHQRLIVQVEEAYKNIKTSQGQLKQLQEENFDIDRDYILFQMQEIDALNLKGDEESSLEQKFDYYKNMELIFRNMQLIQESFSSDENPYSLKETLINCSKWINPLSSYDDDLKSISDTLHSIMYTVDDLNHDIRRFVDQLEVDEEDMFEVESRMNAINGLKLKHGKTVEDILNKRQTLALTLKNADEHLSNLEDLKLELHGYKKKYLELAGQLNHSRLEIKGPFEERVMAEMAMLNMADGVFQVTFEESNLEEGAFRLSKSGVDQVSFLISTNPGMPLSPLSKVASGGEISRMMLAIKMALSHHDDVKTLVFDEVDTGISGTTALIVGEKMHLLTKNYQVILITHLPQIAVMADGHFKIDKAVADNITESSVFKIEDGQRLKEMARMLSGKQSSAIAIENAHEMFRDAEKFKKSVEVKS